MIPPESKAKLEEMALKVKSRGDFVYMAGATAAWKMATELAVKTERERIANLILEISGGHEITIDRAMWNRIINPPKDEAEK